MRASGINHVSISASDLDASVRFYTEVFGMERVASPTFPGQRVAWLRLGEQQLHLFEREVAAPQFHHLGLDVDDFEAVYLKVRELAMSDDSTFAEGVIELPGGEAQMYLRDPDGNLIEVDWPDASTLDRNVVGEIVRLADTLRQEPESLGARLYLGGGAAAPAPARAHD